MQDEWEKDKRMFRSKMKLGRHSKIPAPLYFGLILVLLVLPACSTGLPYPQPTPTLSDIYRVENTFRQFYLDHGGRQVLGPVIQAAYNENGILKQYVMNGMMRYDPYAPQGQRFSFAPLGSSFSIPSYLLPPPDAKGIRAKPEIDPGFLVMYQFLGGPAFVGPAISIAFTDVENGRYIQYFQNVGFYRLLDDPEGDVQLLPYGAYACGAFCGDAVPLNALPEIKTEH